MMPRRVRRNNGKPTTVYNYVLERSARRKRLDKSNRPADTCRDNPSTTEDRLRELIEQSWLAAHHIAERPKTIAKALRAAHAEAGTVLQMLKPSLAR